MAKRIINSTPRQDGFRMPGEFEKQAGMWMLWPERNDNWRNGGKPAQEAFANVAKAIAEFEPVTVCVSAAQYQNCRAKLPEEIRVVEMANDDAWIRDCGPTFVIDDEGRVRGVDWEFNAWGGLYDDFTSRGQTMTRSAGRSARSKISTLTARTDSCWRAVPFT